MFTKNLHLCLSKIKCLPTPFSPPPTLGEKEGEEELGGEETNHQSSLSSSTTSLTMMKSFNSAYDLSSSSSTCTSDDFFSPYHNTSNNSEPDFSTVFSSPRFFVSSPGRSNSILDSASETNRDTDPAETSMTVVGRVGVAIRKYSPDPYTDFRKSMQEMIEARENGSTSRDWEYLHELLLCYLNLNPQPAHRFIISAFTDLLVSLLSSPDSHLSLPTPEAPPTAVTSRPLR